MRVFFAVFWICLIFPGFSSAAGSSTNTTDGQPQTIYINNEIPAEVLRAYNEQAKMIADMRVRMTELEHLLFQTSERLANLEAEVWDK